MRIRGAARRVCELLSRIRAARRHVSEIVLRMRGAPRPRFTSFTSRVCGASISIKAGFKAWGGRHGKNCRYGGYHKPPSERGGIASPKNSCVRLFVAAQAGRHSDRLIRLATMLWAMRRFAQLSGDSRGLVALAERNGRYISSPSRVNMWQISYMASIVACPSFGQAFTT